MNAPAPPDEPPMAQPSTTSSPSTPSSDSSTATPVPATPTRATGKAAVDAGAKRRNDDDEEDEWRHEPVAPVDERNPLRSLGKAVSDAVLGGDDAGAPTAPATPKR